MQMRIFPLILAIMLSGCIAGKVVTISPKEVHHQYVCEPFTIRPDGIFSDGFAVLYYIVPLWPLTNNSDTSYSLEIPITIHSDKEPVFDFVLQDVMVRIPELQSDIAARSIKKITETAFPNKPWYYKTFKFTFDIDRNLLSEFTLIFPNPVHDCKIPDTPYVRKEKWHIITPTM